MAGRGGPKLKEYRTAIASIKQWQSEVSFPHLSVVEVYSSSFGACQVILPTINSIMTNMGEGAEGKVKWLTINVGKLEEEQKVADDQEQKKQSEQQMDAADKRGKTPSIAPAANLPTVDSTHILIDTTEHKEQPPPSTAGSNNDDESADSGDGVDAPSRAHPPSSAAALDPSSPTVPLLEAYHAYDHPRPLWLFFLAGQLQYELTSANPPKMLKLVQACLSGDKLSAEDLQGMELQTDSAEVAAEKRRKRLLKKKEEEEAKRKAKELEEAQQARKKREIVRTTPEYLLHVSLAQYTNQVGEGVVGEAGTTTKQPVLVLYWKDGESDYYYHSQTVRAAVAADASVVFPSSLVFKKAETAEAESHIELRVCLYEVDDDEPIKGEREGQGLLGEGYVQLSALTGGQTEVRIVHRDMTVPPLSPTAKSPRAVVRVDKLMALASIKVKQRVSEGTLSDYRFTVAVNGLAAASAPADGATLANAYTVKLHALDDTSPVYTRLGSTEPSSALPLVFTTPLPATHYSGLPRQLRFTLHSEDGAAINTADVPFASLLGRGSNVIVSTLDAAGGVSSVELALRVDEVDEDCNVIVPAAPALSEEEKARQAALQWLQLSFTADGLNAAASISQSAVVAVYQEDNNGAMSLLGTTEPLPAAATLSWQQTLFVPRDEVVKRKYKAVLVDTTSASTVAGAAVLGQHVFDLAWLPPQAEQPTVQQTTDLPLETSEGLPVEGECKLHIAAQSVGQLQTLNLTFAVNGLELAEGDAAVNAIVAVYRVQGGLRQLVGQTERVAGSAPFTRAVDVTSYADAACPLQLCVYNASADDVLLDSELVAECTLNAEQLRYTDSSAATVPLTVTTALKQGESAITVTNSIAVERPNGPEQQEKPSTAEAAAASTQQQPEAVLAAGEAAAQQPAIEQTSETQTADASSQAAVDEGNVQSLVFTFDAKDVKGVDGELTLTLHGADSVTGTEVELGRTSGTPVAERIAFATPITLLAFSAAHRQVRVVLAAGAEVVGEAAVAVESLSQERSTANKYVLTKAGESTGASVSIRVNAHADDPRPVSVSSTPAIDKSARSLTPRPPASPATKPPHSPSASVSKAPASPSKSATTSSTRTTPRIPSKAPSTHATPRVTPRTSAELPKRPSVSLSRKPSVSKKDEEQKAGEHSRQVSRSPSKRSPVVSARKEAQPPSVPHSRQTSRSVSKRSELSAAPSVAPVVVAAPAAVDIDAAQPTTAVETAAVPSETPATQPEVTAEGAPTTEPEPETKASSETGADTVTAIQPQSEQSESVAAAVEETVVQAEEPAIQPAEPQTTETEAAEDDYADDAHTEQTDEPANAHSTAAEATAAIDSAPQQEDEYHDDAEPTAADETVPVAEAQAITEGSEQEPQPQPTAAEEKAEGAQQEAESVQADVVATNEGEAKQEASVGESEDDYADDTESEAAAE